MVPKKKKKRVCARVHTRTHIWDQKEKWFTTANYVEWDHREGLQEKTKILRLSIHRAAVTSAHHVSGERESGYSLSKSQVERERSLRLGQWNVSRCAQG